MDEEEKLLREYELCQKENHEQYHGYWTIFGIFTSLNVALLGGLAYGFLSKFLNITSDSPKVPETLYIISVVVVVGGGIIGITVMLKNWLDRANFLTRTNWKRIHAIEARLDMFSSLQVHIVDKWNRIRARKKREGNLCEQKKEEILNEVWKELGEELTANDLDRIKNNYKERIDKACTSLWPKYTLPAGNIAGRVFWIICAIWILLIASVISIFLTATLHW